LRERARTRRRRRRRPAARSRRHLLVCDTGFREQIGGPPAGPPSLRAAASTITVDLSGCELTERWDGTPERWREWRYCVEGDEWQLRSVPTTTSFFGRVEEYSIAGSGRRVPRPAQVEEGFRWTDRCRARAIPGDRTRRSGLRGAVKAAGATVEAVLPARAHRAERARAGRVPARLWLRRKGRPAAARTFDSETSVRSVIGTVPARERYELSIRTLEPDTGG